MWATLGDMARTARMRAPPRSDAFVAFLALVADRPVARDYPADIGGTALDDALNDLAWDLAAAEDPHASARYRRELVRRLGRQTIEEAKLCRA